MAIPFLKQRAQIEGDLVTSANGLPDGLMRQLAAWDSRTRLRVLLGVLVVLLALSVTFAVTIGPVYISPATVWKIIASHVFGLAQGDWTRTAKPAPIASVRTETA